MAETIAVMGESGAGKSSSMEGLDEKHTLYIDADGKGLPFKGSRKRYNASNRNYLQTSDKAKIEKYIVMCDQNKDWQHINYIVIDTINAIMIDDEFNRMKDKGYDKWLDLAFSIYDLVQVANKCKRQDLYIIFVAHTQTERDESGFQFTRIKTSGKKLDKIVLESKFTTVLHAKKIDGQYVFETQANDSTAKSPRGMLEATMPNDMNAVIEAMKKYYDGE